MSQVFKINGIDYEFECELSNSDNQKISFTKSSIRGMTIIDNIFDPFSSGSVSIANPYDYIENEYLLRGDGRDKMSIKFKPVDGKDSVEFNQKFVIINDSTSGTASVRSENIKTFALIHEDAIRFSDQTPYNKSYSGKIGKILRDIFIEVLGEDRVDKDNWEDGELELTYSAPLSYRYVDMIHYLMRIYYAKDGDLNVKGFINLDHKKNKYNLILLSKTFSDNSKLLLEAFSLGDLTHNIQTSNPNNPPPEAKTSEYIAQIKNVGYSTPLYAWNNDFFVNSLVFGYDHISGIHSIRKLKILDIKDKWKTKFVDVFKSLGGKPKPFVITNNSTNKKFKQYRLPYNINDNVGIVEAELYNALTFYNLHCVFRNIGNSDRDSGKFIDIYKTNDTLLKSDEKLLGRWFITEIRHIFYGDIYHNEFLCTKTYVGPNSNSKLDVT